MMNNKINIRSYDPKDKSQLLEILKLNIPQFFAQSEIDDFDEYLECKIEKYFVAEIEDKIVGGGGINFEDNNQAGKISWDIIDPKFQRKGIGKELLKYRIELLKSLKSIKNIKVRTSQFAYQFYEKNGFSLQNIVKDYWAKGFDLYDMRYQE